MNQDQHDEIVSYDEILDHLEKEQDGDPVLWKFKKIVGHEGPLDRNHPNCKGSSCNVKMEWESGETTYEPLLVAAADNPVICAQHAGDNNLLDKVGWKKFKHLYQHKKKMLRMINQAHLRSF